MNFKEELEEFREKEKFKRGIINFINLTRTMERKEKTFDACPYLAVCPNTEEAIAIINGVYNAPINMDPTIDCVNGPGISQCPIYEKLDNRFLNILEIIEGERVMRYGMSQQQKEGRE